MSDAVIIALITAVVSVIGTIVSAYVVIRLGRVEKKVDGKMDELGQALTGRARAEGITEGEQAQRDRSSQGS